MSRISGPLLERLSLKPSSTECSTAMCSIKPYASRLKPKALHLDGPSVPARKKLLQITPTSLLDGLLNLPTDGLLKSPMLDVPEDSDGFGELRVTHARQQVDECRVGLLVMEQQVLFFDFAIGQVGNFQGESFQPDPFIFVLAKDHRLAMLEFDRRVVASRFVLGITKRTIVEDIAVLIDLDKARASMLRGPFENGRQVLDVAIDRSCDEGRFGSDGNADRIQGMVDDTHRCTLGDLTLDARR